MKLTKLFVEDFDLVFGIMRESFPADERREYNAQRALFENPDFSIFGVKDEGEIKAFITVYELGEFIFAEHFAVAPRYRNCGLGSETLRLLKEIVKSPICLEVELPEGEMAKRRIGFYERNGFFYNDYDYLQPAYSKDKNPVPLRIMTTNGPITEEEFQNLRCKLYNRVYNAT